jgi:hypothetical protein
VFDNRNRLDPHIRQPDYDPSAARLQHREGFLSGAVRFFKAQKTTGFPVALNVFQFGSEPYMFG